MQEVENLDVPMKSIVQCDGGYLIGGLVSRRHFMLEVSNKYAGSCASQVQILHQLVRLLAS